MSEEIETGSQPLSNDKWEKFAQQYTLDPNKSKAAVKAGYSTTQSNSKGGQLYAIVLIKDRILYLQAKVAEKVGVEAEDVLRQLDLFRKAKIQDYIELKSVEINKGTKKKPVMVVEQSLIFKDFSELTEEQLSCIDSIKQGKHGIELKLHGKEWTIEKINRHIGFYLEDNKQTQPQGPPIIIQHPDGPITLKEE